MDNNEKPIDKRDAFAEKALRLLNKEFVLVGKDRVRSVYAWLVIGIIAGVAGGVVFVASQNSQRVQFQTSEASCVPVRFRGGTLVPTTVAPGRGYAITCNYGMIDAYIWPRVGSGSCTYTGWNGTAAQFSCTAGTRTGTFNNDCTFNDARYCQNINPIQSLTVSSGFACAQGYDDMTKWMLPTNMQQHVQGTNLKVYASTSPGKMYFVKSANGFPLDEKRYDTHYVYDSVTENGQLGWGNPGDVKQFINSGVKLAPRCVPVGAPGQKLSTVTNDPSTTYFVTKTNCQVTARNNLGYIKGEVWNVGTHNFGGSIGNTDTRVLKYMWNCDSNYNNCRTDEELWLARGYGWVEWKNYNLINGQYVLEQDTLANNVVSGNVAPNQPCGDAPVQ